MSRPATEVSRRRLPLWLSWPVVLSAPLVLVLIGFHLVSEPEAIPLAIVPLAIVAPALVWLDRVHPPAVVGPRRPGGRDGGVAATVPRLGGVRVRNRRGDACAVQRGLGTG